MPEGPLGGPRPLANGKEVFLSFRINRGEELTPRELMIQRKFAELRGPEIGELDVQIETLEDGDVIISEEIAKGMELSAEQMKRLSRSIEDELNVEVRSSFIRVL